MNYLAHAFLSPDDRYILTGNLVKDMIKGSERHEINRIFQPGLELHMEIDRYTDQHNDVRRMIKMLHIRFSKYAPVVLDIFMDYLLFKNWTMLNNDTFENFKQDVYTKIISTIPELPTKVSTRISGMVQQDWLTAYTDQEGLNKVFYYLQKRLKFPVDVAFGSYYLLEQYDEMVILFSRFMTDIKQHLSTYTFSNQ